MIDALKNTPAVDFRIPPGLRLYRVSAATGLPVTGNEPAIYEAYKPGTEPGKNPNLGQQANSSPRGDESAPADAADDGSSDAASSSVPPPSSSADMVPANSGDAGQGVGGPAAPPGGGPAPAGNSAMLPAHGAPAGGTGGLY
jgi:penicillin-binding protein 1A